MGPGSAEHVKDQQVLGESNAGAVVEGGWASTGNEVSGAGAQDREQVDEPPAKELVKGKAQNRVGIDGLTAKERVAGSSVKRGLAAQQVQAR